MYVEWGWGCILTPRQSGTNGPCPRSGPWHVQNYPHVTQKGKNLFAAPFLISFLSNISKTRQVDCVEFGCSDAIGRKHWVYQGDNRKAAVEASYQSRHPASCATSCVKNRATDKSFDPPITALILAHTAERTKRVGQCAPFGDLSGHARFSPLLVTAVSDKHHELKDKTSIVLILSRLHVP